MAAGAELPRAEVLESLLGGIRAGPPLLLTGPPGSGKTTLLRRLAREVERSGSVAVHLDLMGAASSPERFVEAALEALPAERFAELLPKAVEIRRVLAGGRRNGAAAVQALFALWAGLDRALGRPVVLLLDEATEIRSLAYFEGLRSVAEPFAQALARRRGTLLATSYPTLARQLWRFEAIALPPLSPSELTTLAPPSAATLLHRASFGWPRYAAILADALRGHEGSVLDAFCAEMAPGGRLEQACRHTWEALLLRSRGYGVSKALLAMVAEDDGANLTALYRRLGRSPGATRDYLLWLVGVDALRFVRKRYSYVDGLLRIWVLLHGRGQLADAARIRAAGEALLSRSEGENAESEAARTPAVRRDSLMEID